MFDKPNGAFTGEISADQLSDSGITWALCGHSERRIILKEDDKVSVNPLDRCDDFGGGDGEGEREQLEAGGQDTGRGADREKSERRQNGADILHPI